ncbi:MAG TPA: hypothetical protein VHN77_11955, partial [Phycisphaerales bacterium]|nr:hypothetical protein [Phycisphaerales bacterium]
SMASFDHTVRALTVLPNGDLVAAGQFVTVDGRVAPHIARFRTPVGCTPACDPIDFNADTLFPDTTDITDFLTVFSGGVCSDQLPTDPPCNTDIDFNNDGLFPDTDDITVFLRVFSGGQCG